MDKKYKLVYFNFRGVAEPIRWMLKMKHVEFEEERIDLDYWPKEKHRFSKHLGQLPILYIDEDTALTQVHSIMRYIAKQVGLAGETELETARANQVVEMVYEMFLSVASHRDCFTTATPDIVWHSVFNDFQSERNMSKKVLMRTRLIYETFPGCFSKFVQYLDDSGGEYLAGENLTFADLVVANFLDICEQVINPDILNEFPTLRVLKEEVLDIPEIAEYVAEMSVSNAPGA